VGTAGRPFVTVGLRRHRAALLDRHSRSGPGVTEALLQGAMWPTRPTITCLRHWRLELRTSPHGAAAAVPRANGLGLPKPDCLRAFPGRWPAARGWLLQR